MNQYTILCVDDEREVLDSLLQDIKYFSNYFEIEGAESVSEARAIVEELSLKNKKLALILCDHVMPGENGVDFLIDLNTHEETQNTCKILVTGQAGLEATIDAINRGGLDYYISKPWDAEHLKTILIEHLTRYMIANEEDLMTYTQILDGQKIFNAIHKRGDL
ncbi:response regulator [Deltaproteobacteria bacterium TL4]